MGWFAGLSPPREIDEESLAVAIKVGTPGFLVRNIDPIYKHHRNSIGRDADRNQQQ